MFNVIRAYMIAKEAHKGQKDKAGEDYIKHPVYVAKHVKGRDAKVVALLHDVVEDTDKTIDFIRGNFGDKIAEAVSLLTHDKSVPYAEYVLSIKANDLARKVKIQDLRHNMNLCRLKEVTVDDARRVKKYACALEELLNYDGLRNKD